MNIDNLSLTFFASANLNKYAAEISVTSRYCDKGMPICTQIIIKSQSANKLAAPQVVYEHAVSMFSSTEVLAERIADDVERICGRISNKEHAQLRAAFLMVNRQSFNV